MPFLARKDGGIDQEPDQTIAGWKGIRRRLKLKSQR
jgi:hypothetical protein